MGTKDRRTTADGRRTTDLVRPRAVETLDITADFSQDDVVVEGKQVLIPGNFGSDGMDHWLGAPRVSPNGSVSLFKH